MIGSIVRLLWSGGACSSTPVIANGFVFGAYGSISAYALPEFNPASIAARPQLFELKPDYALAAQRMDDWARTEMHREGLTLALPWPSTRRD